MPDNPKTNRRDFLSVKGALKAARAKANTTEINVPENLEFQGSLERQSNYVEQYSKNAMACEFELFFNLHQYQQSGAAAMRGFQLIDELEDQMTVYRSHSEVSQINQTAERESVEVEPKLFELLLKAKGIYEETGKAFDITSGSVSKVWGFDQRAGEMPTDTAIATALGNVGMNKVVLDEASCSIRFSSPTDINLNGIGKGHALDRVAREFESKGICDFMIHGGQSSVLARGSSLVSSESEPPEKGQPTDVEESDLPDEVEQICLGWKVGVSHPTLPGKRLGEFTLRNRALGTSGTARQGFFHKGKRYGHIVDPRTGWPAGHFLSTTVVSKSAALSDALATAFFVMHVSEIEEFCNRHPDVSAILVEANPKVKGKVDLVSFNVIESDWQRVV